MRLTSRITDLRFISMKNHSLSMLTAWSAAAVLGVDHQQVVLGLVHPEIPLVRPNEAPAGEKVHGRGSGGDVAALSVCVLLRYDDPRWLYLETSMPLCATGYAAINSAILSRA